MAVDVLKSKGVPEDRILFLNLIASPEGVTSFAKRFPRLRVVTAFVDQGLDEKKCVPFQFTDFRSLTLDSVISFLDSETLETVSIHSEPAIGSHKQGWAAAKPYINFIIHLY